MIPLRHARIDDAIATDSRILIDCLSKDEKRMHYG